jgi:hypothetical protein
VNQNLPIRAQARFYQNEEGGSRPSHPNLRTTDWTLKFGVYGARPRAHEPDGGTTAEMPIWAARDCDIGGVRCCSSGATDARVTSASVERPDLTSPPLADACDSRLGGRRMAIGPSPCDRRAKRPQCQVPASAIGAPDGTASMQSWTREPSGCDQSLLSSPSRRQISIGAVRVFKLTAPSATTRAPATARRVASLIAMAPTGARSSMWAATFTVSPSTV